MKTIIKLPASMPAFIRNVLLVAALLTAGAAYADGLQVNAVVDVTPEGRNAVRPSPSSPVYYFPFTVGYQEQGSWGAENLPSTLEVQRMIAKALAAQGYLVMHGKEAGLLLTFQWGRMAPFAEERLNDPEEAMATLVGGANKGADFDQASPALANFQFAASVPRYFVTIEAFDFNAAKEKNKVPLWIARFSAQAGEGLTLESALPSLLAVGAPLLGEDVRPQRISAP